MDAVANYGMLSLLPVTAVIVTAIITKRALEPLVIGTLIGFLILDGPNFVFSYLDSLYMELGESAYFIIIFGLFGKFLNSVDSRSLKTVI